MLNDISKQLGDVKFPPANARAKTHWGKHTGSYSEQKPAHPGIHFYTEHVACSTNKQTQFNNLTLFVQAISITVMHFRGSYGSHTHIPSGVWWPEPKRGFAIETKL